MYKSWRQATVLSVTLFGYAHGTLAEQNNIDWRLNERVEMVKVGSGIWSNELETTFFKPPGDGPFPLVVINHGKAFGDPRFDPRARFVAASREFLKMGYVVALPMRPGFSKSTGSYVDSKCNIRAGGLTQAEVVDEFIDTLKAKPFIDAKNILVVGQSHGGLTVMALSTKKVSGVKGIVNFAGGYKYEASGMNHCNWQQTMVEAFASYGRNAKIPSLWFYGDNDSYWGAELPKHLYEAYRNGSGEAQLISFGVYPYGDAHKMFGDSKGVPIWLEPTRAFMKKVGLPTAVTYNLIAYPRPAKSNFAAIDDATAIPHLPASKRDAYLKFLKASSPRAFALSSDGHYGWSSDGTDPLGSAILNCEKYANTTCSLYAVDEDVVWQTH